MPTKRDKMGDSSAAKSTVEIDSLQPIGVQISTQINMATFRPTDEATDIPNDSENVTTPTKLLENQISQVDTINANERMQVVSDFNEAFRIVSENIIRVLIPVMICICTVLISHHMFAAHHILIGQMDPMSTYDVTYRQQAGLPEPLWKAFGNMLIMLACIITSTLVLLTMFYLKLYRCILGWIVMVSTILLTLFACFWVINLLQYLNLPLDRLTVWFLLFNNAVIGLLTVFQLLLAPLMLEQMYLLQISFLVASRLLVGLPATTGWLLLIAVSVWDVLAVCFYHGPLNMLIRLAQSRNHPIMPAMLYSTLIWYSTDVEPAKKVLQDAESSSSKAMKNLNELPISHPDHPIKRRLKLGLGDFIFYSLLVGKSTESKHIMISLACILTILIGLSGTLFLLYILQKPLPALPISIFLAVTTYFGCSHFLIPIQIQFNQQQLMV